MSDLRKDNKRAAGASMPDRAIALPLSLLCKLGSIAVHAEEMLSAKGHAYDRIALDGLLKDEEVIAWLKQMKVYLPVKR